MITRDESSADDLLQEAVVRALTAPHRFVPGTNLVAWVYTILRNQHVSNWRRRRRLTAMERSPEAIEASEAMEGNQESRVELSELQQALDLLPLLQREALLLVGPASLSYEDAAVAIGCSVGTVKSRVSRARAALRTALEGKITTAAGTEIATSPAGTSTSVGSNGRQRRSQAGRSETRAA